ncbi:MAG: 16S rRNA (adenine(1518)-N(6)/adenine(1519)-N(6))-dimethyltransferase RsmA [bacterium]|nr:16S rRNA (adenine(1518)-N(6)/adenine(1519)-N(6))-dimethyltransferase RsmA [bacterium]
MQKLGQHFLKSKKIIEKIVDAAELSKNDTVLEVGPGKGILTEALLEKASKVIAVEKDKELVRYLTDKFEGSKNLTLIHGDILKIPIKDMGYKIVANIPYYITSRFLRQFLTTNPRLTDGQAPVGGQCLPAGRQPQLMVLMIQKEVAQRIVATAPQMSILSVSVQAYTKPKIICMVSKRYFSPPPKVDSAIIKLENISRAFFTENKIDEEKFFALVKKGFGQKRKMLKNNLNISSETLKNCRISEKARAQELSLENWVCVYRKQSKEVGLP